MKILCMHLKIFLCVFVFLVLLGIITVAPCEMGRKNSLLGRSYGFDKNRLNELTDKAKNKICCMCKKG